MGLSDATGAEYASLICQDLRNPLTALMGHAERLYSLLHKQGLEPETSKAESILKSARLLTAMVRDLEEWSRQESCRLDVPKNSIPSIVTGR